MFFYFIEQLFNMLTIFLISSFFIFFTFIIIGFMLGLATFFFGGKANKRKAWSLHTNHWKQKGKNI